MSVDRAGATVNREGRLRRASTFLVPDVAPGDWVLVTAGTILERLPLAEAELIRATLLEVLAADVTDAAAAAPAGAPIGGSR